MVGCPNCGAEIDPMSIRCYVCGRSVARNKQEMLRLRARMMQANISEEQSMSSDHKAILNSWMYAQARTSRYKYRLFDRVIDVLLNSVVISLSVFAIFLVIVYVYAQSNPEQSLNLLISLNLIEKPTPIVIN